MRSNNMLIFFLDDQTLKTCSFTEQRNDGFVMTWKRLQVDEDTAIKKQTNEKIYTDRQTDRQRVRQTDRFSRKTDRQSSEE